MGAEITLVYTEYRQRGYNLMKNKKSNPDRLEAHKYCKFCKKHTLYEKTKQLANMVVIRARRDQGYEVMVVKENINLTKNSPSKGGILKLSKEVKAETRRTAWPSKDGTKKTLIAVDVIVLICTVLVGGLDYTFQNLFEFIFKLE